MPPQPAQAPEARQRSPPAQGLPAAMHILERESQHPPVQVSPVQQGCPGPPHALHRLPEHTVPAAEQTAPGQHGPPACPQVWQVPR